MGASVLLCLKPRLCPSARLTLRQVVVLSRDDRLEACNVGREGHELALPACEHLGDRERLREEALQAARAGHGELVVLRQLVHAKNGNNVLERLVLLENLLDTAGGEVVLRADDVGVHETRRRVERVDGGVDTELGNRARKHRRGVEVGERRRGRGVRKIVGGHVHGLHGRDGALGRRRDALLERAHVGRERRLVADGRGNTAEKGRHLGAGLQGAGVRGRLRGGRGPGTIAAAAAPA